MTQPPPPQSRRSHSPCVGHGDPCRSARSARSRRDRHATSRWPPTCARRRFTFRSWASDAEQKLCLHGLQSARGFLQSKLAERIETRYTPRLQFILDMGVKRSLEVARILSHVLAGSQDRLAGRPAASPNVVRIPNHPNNFRRTKPPKNRPNGINFIEPPNRLRFRPRHHSSPQFALIHPALHSMSHPNRTALLTKTHRVLKQHYKPVHPPTNRTLLEHLLFACCLENAPYDAAEKIYAYLVEALFRLERGPRQHRHRAGRGDAIVARAGRRRLELEADFAGGLRGDLFVRSGIAEEEEHRRGDQVAGKTGGHDPLQRRLCHARRSGRPRDSTRTAAPGKC